MSKIIIPILAILGGALYIRHCIKDSQKEGSEERFMVVDDPYSDAEYYVPDFGPGGEP